MWNVASLIMDYVIPRVTVKKNVELSIAMCILRYLLTSNLSSFSYQAMFFKLGIENMLETTRY